MLSYVCCILDVCGLTFMTFINIYENCSMATNDDDDDAYFIYSIYYQMLWIVSVQLDMLKLLHTSPSMFHKIRWKRNRVLWDMATDWTVLLSVIPFESTISHGYCTWIVLIGTLPFSSCRSSFDQHSSSSIDGENTTK